MELIDGYSIIRTYEKGNIGTNRRGTNRRGINRRGINRRGINRRGTNRRKLWTKGEKSKNLLSLWSINISSSYAFYKHKNTKSGSSVEYSHDLDMVIFNLKLDSDYSKKISAYKNICNLFVKNWIKNNPTY